MTNEISIHSLSLPAPNGPSLGIDCCVCSSWGFTSPIVDEDQGDLSGFMRFTDENSIHLLYDYLLSMWIENSNILLPMKVNNDLPKNTLKTYKSFFFRNAEMDIVAAV